MTEIRLPESQKVFVIGFHKTGTTSLAEALHLLNYKTVHGDARKAAHGGTEGRLLLEEYIKKGNYRLPTFDLYDAFTDNPYFSIWKELVRMFPDARYILTVRDEKAWISSCIKYYKGRRVRPMREWMFGPHADPSRDKEGKKAWLVAYRRHNSEIIEYFKSAGKDLLVIDISRQGWQMLCEYLNKPVPSTPFPHRNKTEKSRYEAVKSMLPISVRRKISTWFK
jgi:hypothetical protein